MPVRENAYYWEYSLEHPESEFDGEPYIHDKFILENTNYLEKVNYLRDLLTTYCILIKINETTSAHMQSEATTQPPVANVRSENSRNTCHKVLQEIDRLLLNVDDIQHTEFVAYFKCLGISHSDYRKKVDLQQRLAVLARILERYCERRKEQYDQFGYTHVIQQALYDSAVSRTQGSSGVQKLRHLIAQVSQESVGVIYETHTAFGLVNSQYDCFLPIASKKREFFKIVKEMEISYEYGSKNQQKIPDLVIKIKGKLLILEAKHIKESGGAQDKQINELITFIRQKENKPVSYVAFLDGRYFNKFIGTSLSGKVQEQRDAIEKVLQEHPSNYFVNTAGLRQLLTDLLSGTTAGSDN
jgi:Holliday junction resolvase